MGKGKLDTNKTEQIEPLRAVALRRTRHEFMKVTIDGVEYLPVSQFSEGADEKGKAIIRMLISGYYTNIDCHRDGKPAAMANNCECAGCHAFRTAVQFLGSEPVCRPEPLISAIWRACETK